MARHAAFHPLRVAAVEVLTDDAVAITFDVPAQLRDDYAFVQGQHVAICAPAVGDDLRRSYSICSPAGSGVLRIAVKRLPSGALSTYLHERLRCGDELEVMTPAGRFFTQLDRANKKHYVAIAAGSGITPIISIVASVLALEPHSRVTLLYGNRITGSIMFLDELADLKDRYIERLALHHILSREANEIDLLHGRINGAKLERFIDEVIALEGVDEWFLCGPREMLEDLRGTLLARGVDRADVHRELFYAGPVSANGPVQHADAELSQVTVLLDGRASTFEMPRAGVSILDAAMRVRSDVPYACKGGVCGTCRARILEGRVSLDSSYALEDHELTAGFVLTCQAHPTTDTVQVDFDA
jgi:ring-1,2-phenylacetyl-CoA epoxidase subunit PaaE